MTALSSDIEVLAMILRGHASGGTAISPSAAGVFATTLAAIAADVRRLEDRTTPKLVQTERKATS